MSTNGNKGKFSERLYRMKINRIKIIKYGKMDELDEELKKENRKAILIKSVLIPPMIIIGAFIGNKEEDKKKITVNKENNKQEDIVTIDVPKLKQEDEKVIDDSNKNTIVNHKKKMVMNYDNDSILELDIIDNSKVSEKKNEDVKSVKIGSDVTTLKERLDIKEGKHEEIKQKNVGLVEEKSDEKLEQKHVGLVGEIREEELNLDEKNNRQKLEKSILDLFKKRFIKNINELEMIQSDLYILSEIDSNDIEYKKCLENIDEVKKLIKKVRELKEKYDFLEDNYDFEYLLELKDDSLIDKIIDLRNICSKSELDDVIEEYKLLDEYQYLYRKIDEVEKKAVEFEDYKDKKVLELEERDIKFKDFKDNVVNLDRMKESYENFVIEQNEILRNLEEKLRKIDSSEQLETRIKGFDQLINSTFKYMGLLLVSPLRGLIPSIATEMIITRNVIKNLRENLCLEERRKMIYTAIDYDSSIKYAIENVENVSGLVDKTIEDVIKLKKEFKDRFEEYSSEFPEYEEVIKKLNKMENSIAGNRVKLTTTVNKLKRDRLVNKNKMERVKKLNSESKETIKRYNKA